jgi:acetoacetyl-CoA synthetase
MQVRCLGAKVEAFERPRCRRRGPPLIDEVGELVCTEPMPSMPLRCGATTSGQRCTTATSTCTARAMAGAVWRHGDWIRMCRMARGHGAVIYGRSDATINRHGIRMGTAELYRAVEVQPEVLDSLVVDLEYLGRESWMPLFVVLREGLRSTARSKRAARGHQAALSARHVPDDHLPGEAIPRTLSGKKMELPVKKLLMGADPAQVLNRDAMANADSIDWFVALAAKARAAHAG